MQSLSNHCTPLSLYPNFKNGIDLVDGDHPFSSKHENKSPHRIHGNLETIISNVTTCFSVIKSKTVCPTCPSTIDGLPTFSFSVIISHLQGSSSLAQGSFNAISNQSCQFYLQHIASRLGSGYGSVTFFGWLENSASRAFDFKLRRLLP